MVAYAGPGWRVPPSLRALFEQADEIAPNRSDASDGTIGNQEHQERKSDHNPDLSGDVLAGDLTDDVPAGIDARKLAETIRLRRDPRIKYVISEGQMFASYTTPKRRAWEWGTYVGPNGHFKHVHVSILDEPFAKSDTSPWFAAAAPPQPTPPEDDDMGASFGLAVAQGSAFRFHRGADGLLWVKIGAGNSAAFNGQGGRPLCYVKEGTTPAAASDGTTVTVLIVGLDGKGWESARNAQTGNFSSWVAVGGQPT